MVSVSRSVFVLVARLLLFILFFSSTVSVTFSWKSLATLLAFAGKSCQSYYICQVSGPDSSVVRAFASGAVSRRFDPWQRLIKGDQNSNDSSHADTRNKG